jgi:copper chaperone
MADPTGATPDGRESGHSNPSSFQSGIEKVRQDEETPTMSRTLTVEGMTCEHCEGSVEDALEAVAGVRDATADREAERATVEGDADPDALVAAVVDAGYDASA